MHNLSMGKPLLVKTEKSEKVVLKMMRFNLRTASSYLLVMRNMVLVKLITQPKWTVTRCCPPLTFRIKNMAESPQRDGKKQ